MNYQTSDIILFKGNGVLSTVIMLATGADYSHVGLFIDHPDHGPCIFESTSLGILPDLITGKPINGVQLVPFEERVKSYDGEVFHRPIIGDRSEDHISAFLDYIELYHGTPYEKHNLQLMRAELDIFPWQRNEPDPSSLFCSENTIMCLRDTSFIEDDGTPANEGTPTDCSDGYLKLKDGFSFGDIVLI